MTATNGSYRMLINGQLVSGGAGTFDVINPSSGQAFAQAPACSREQLDEAVTGAQAALKTWATTSLEQRREVLRAAAKVLRERVEAISEVLVKEQGKPLFNAKGEVGAVPNHLEAIANIDFAFEKVLIDNDTERVVQRQVPLGVVGAITPWNFPPYIAGGKISEALITGCTVVLKPSPYTPLSTLMMGEALASVVPAGVVNIISGGNDLGQWMTEHPGIAKISFTGSSRTGKAIKVAAAASMKRVTLELGGNDPAIVLPEADVKQAAAGIFGRAMLNTGQVCTAVKRCYVHEGHYDALLAEFVDMAGKAKVGDGFDSDVKYGPLNNKMQFDRVKGLVEDAQSKGATVHAGGKPLPGEGYFYPPTILTGVSEGTAVVDEEQFGPVLPVMVYKDVSDAVQRANATNYGLGASVWGSDLEQAAEVAAQLDAGMTWVNSHGNNWPTVPFGGMKESGYGRERGDGTLQSHTEMKVIRVPKRS